MDKFIYKDIHTFLSLDTFMFMTCLKNILLFWRLYICTLSDE